MRRNTFFIVLYLTLSVFAPTAFADTIPWAKRKLPLVAVKGFQNVVLIEPVLAPKWGYKVKPSPRQLSMLMHVTALRFMEKLHPKIDTLRLNPLRSMYKILVKTGFAPAAPDKQVYYGLEISGKDFKQLRDYDALAQVTQ